MGRVAAWRQGGGTLAGTASDPRGWKVWVEKDGEPCWWLPTYTDPGRNRRLADPEGDPGEDHQQAGRDIGFQDKVQDAPLQLKVEDQFGVVSWKEKVTFRLVLQENLGEPWE